MAILARLLLYVAVTIALGGICAHWVRREPWSARLGVVDVRLSLLVGLAALTALLLMFVVQFTALDLAPTANDVAMLMRQTTWGRGWLLLAGIAMTGLALTAVRATLAVRAVVVVAFAVAMGGLGHAAADEAAPLLSRGLDAMHVVSVGVWLGGLLCLGSDLTPTSWSRFSGLAVFAAPLAVLSGVGSALRRVSGGSVSQIVGGDYGRLLAAKLACVALILLVGAWHRRQLRARRVPTVASVRFELLLALVVLGVTAALTGTAPPGE
ncbi:MAG: CopD family protein [Gemmatimonadaceae bacterium]|nr:CopD family protein [Gemmatimonadaceae bacterium]